MKRIITFILVVFVMVSYINAMTRSGDKPAWVNKGEASLNAKRSNDSYYFKAFRMEGSNLDILKANKSVQLSSFIGQYNQIEADAETEITTVSGNDARTNETYRAVYKHGLVTDVFYALLVDEYWDFDNGIYNYYVLFAVSTNGKEPVFDEFSTSTSYGLGAVAMSVIPGLGQMYKGSYLKGGLMMAGTAAGVVSILLCENQRTDYMNKMIQQPQFAKDYNTKASNWETARNIAIGVTAAIYIYNLIDAAAAKGARRVIVKKTNGKNLSLYPLATPYSAGVSLTYNF